MRERRYKIWDNHNKLWLAPETFSIGCDDGKVRNKEGSGCIGGVTPLEYTGLKDKKGSDIYEGHILSHKYYSYPVIVTFKNGCFDSGDVSITDDSLEVIGNIYENPELLNAS